MHSSRKKTVPEGNKFFKVVKNIFFHSQGFPIFLICTVLAILFVLFRMKVVELDYAINTINKKIERVKVDQKELSANKARLLSVKNLRNMAQKHNLSQPKRKQIIVVPKIIDTN